MTLVKSAVAVLIFVTGRTWAVDSKCKDWFKKAEIPVGEGCLLTCSSTTTSFSSLGCAEDCPTLCNESIVTNSVFTLGSLYGLTEAERALGAKEPKKTLRAYQLSWRAEKLCNTLYVASRTNDESDACRHFVWASLMTSELGAEFTNRALNAHEQDLRQPENERAMDLANNRQGQLTAQPGSGAVDEQIVLKRFEENLKKGNLVVLKPSKGNSGVKK